MKMLQAQPALPVKDMARSIRFYRDNLGLSFVLENEGFAIFRRDAVEVHL
jgi:catechol 2,3-dioxygenase-like lactoylglutathione lyase family enzyme